MSRPAPAPPAFDEAPMPDLFSGSMPVRARSRPAKRRPAVPVPDHRARLRARFARGGATAMPDEELLELLLYRALPRGDVRALALRLLAAFGDLPRIMAAPPERLREVSGVGPAVAEQLKMMEALGHRMARARIIDRPVLSSWDALLDYLATALAHQTTERFRVLHLDRRNVLIADEEVARGTVDHVPVYPREVVKRALALDASALILVHNHPSGDPTPSEADIAMTLAVRDAAEVLGLVLHDHLIVGKGEHLSFRSEGLL